MIRIANGQGFLGDSLDAPVQQVRRGPIDYLTLDYLAEVTMSILEKQRSRDPKAGYARDFVDLIAKLLPDLRDRGVRVVANAGGVNPTGCRDALLEVARAQKIPITVGLVTGDDITDQLDRILERGIELRNMDTNAPLASIRDRVQRANVYLGAFPVAEALNRGANIVVSGRVADAALVLGPMIHEFGWSAADVDKLSAGIIAGHVAECGAQVILRGLEREIANVDIFHDFTNSNPTNRRNELKQMSPYRDQINLGEFLRFGADFKNGAAGRPDSRRFWTRRHGRTVQAL